MDKKKVLISGYRLDKPIKARGALGGQLYHMMLGYAVLDSNAEYEFCYEVMRNFRFSTHKLDLIQSNIKELNRTNDVLNAFWKNLGVSRADEDTELRGPVLSECNEDVFNNGALDRMGEAWPMPAPRAGKTLTIHLRQGDAPPSWRQSVDYYNDLIRTCIERFPEHAIQTISWDKPDIDPDLQSKIIMNYEEDGYKFLDHFNEMVHSDILIVAYSSFSWAAGLINKNTVICDEKIIMRQRRAPTSDPLPKKWSINFDKMIG